MPVLHEPSNPRLYEFVKDRNLTLQYYLLETAVDIALQQPNHKFSSDVILALQATAANFLDENPGKIRDGFVHINNSDHIPPSPDDVSAHLQEYLQYLNVNFETATVEHLAAYALWRLAWIHPFNECNGRTSRAFCYYVICVKSGYWMPGKKTIHQMIRENFNEYYGLLKETDLLFKKQEKPKLDGLESYLARFIFDQVS